MPLDRYFVLAVFCIVVPLVGYTIGWVRGFKRGEVSILSHRDSDLPVNGCFVISGRRLNTEYIPRAFVQSKLDQLLKEVS